MNHYFLTVLVCTVLYLVSVQFSGYNSGFMYYGVWVLILGLITIIGKLLIILHLVYLRQSIAKHEADAKLKTRI